MSRQVGIILLGMVGAAFLSWHLWQTGVVETLMADASDESTPISTPLIIAALWGIFLYPVLYHRLGWLRDQVRIVLQLAVVGYVLLGLLVLLGMIAALQGAIEPEMNAPRLVLVLLAIVALLVGSVAAYRELKQG